MSAHFLPCSVIPFHPVAMWFKTTKNRDVSTGPLTRPFARLLAPLTHSLARSAAFILSPTRSFIHFRAVVNDSMSSNHAVLIYNVQSCPFKMRSLISVRGCVRPFVRYTRPSCNTSRISEKWAEFEQKNTKNMKSLSFKRGFRIKYVSRSPERIRCLTSVKLVDVLSCREVA